jgi:sigma-B regulation protein RsbU (phosphoserine phosphatase)
MIGLGDKISGQPYSPADLEFLAALGNLAIISLENARLFKEALEKQKMEDELVIAKEIQRGLLPSSLPEIPGFEFAASSLSSKQVGGDYYDVIPLRENRFVIAIGDVSGKGTPAALLMANLQAAIRALVPLNLPLPELTGRVNDLIADNTGSGRFITFFWGVLDPDGRTLQYVNAGHNPPYLFHRDGSFERLEKGGLILGVMKTTRPYEGGSIGFSPGDVLLLFTDGVSEAMDHEGVEFGEGPLEQVTCESLTQPSASILERIVEKVREHSRGVTQSDDITLLVLRHL